MADTTNAGLRGVEHQQPLHDALSAVAHTSAAEHEEFDENRALLERPSFSLRARLILAFALIFSFCVLLTFWAIYTLSEIQAKINFLEIAGNYMLEIQQARRFEKNFLLYRTNLEDAKEHVLNAERILKENAAFMEGLLGRKSFTTMAEHLSTYRSLLFRLHPDMDDGELKPIEAQLRQHGSQMVTYAMDLVGGERKLVDRIIFWARRIPLLFLIGLSVLMILIATLLLHQFWKTLSRFMEYTRRIGQGDFTPITPRRKYRDEFTRLAIAFNSMIHELDRRHHILIESHKLRAIGTLVAGVAHELNNPLNNTMLTASLLQEDYGRLADSEKLEMIGDILSETERSRKIVKNLLDFARKSEITITSLRVEGILEGSIALVSNQLRMSKVNLVRDNIAADLPPVHGDKQMLEQVFINLILNAADVSPQGVTVTVAAYKAGAGFLAVDIGDNGPGIPEHVLPRIFEPFFTTKGGGRGTGLGLSVCQGIVHRLGGHIQVRSKVGHGTTFTVLLPITDIPSQVSVDSA